jgi:BASS family bile acid:Na+ symporter
MMAVMGSPLTTIALPVALGIIMFGLGLSLTLGDFARIGKHPKAVIIALVCQLLVLPAICFGLVLAFALPPLLAVGMMLLAASPGGTTANLYSHLFRGDIALNISLTAVNSVISVFTLPLIVNFAIGYFKPEVAGEGVLGIDFVEALKVFAIVLIPVALGMLVRRWRPGFATASDKPVRIASIIILAIVIVGAIVSNAKLFFDSIGALAGITVVFCLISLTIGFLIPRLLRVERRQAVASSFEIGIHNATLAIVIAQSVLASMEMSLPAAVYGVLMFFVAAAFGFAIRDRKPVEPLVEDRV